MTSGIIPFAEWTEARLGDIGVYRVERYLHQRRWFVFKSCDLSGPRGDRAPSLDRDEDRIILPDLYASMAGRSRWAEVKTKTEATWTRITNRYEHGISLRHWLNYRRIQEQTGSHVWLFIYQRDICALLASPIDDLANEALRRSQMLNKRSGLIERMVFFPVTAFRLRAELPIDANEPVLFSVQLKLRFQPMVTEPVTDVHHEAS